MSNREIDIEKGKNSKNGDDDEDQNFKTMIKLLNDKKINLANSDHIKYLLSLTLKEEQINFDFQYLLIFLLKNRNEENNDIFYEFFFHCCEIGKLKYIKLFLNNNLSINSQNEIGETPMHIAIKKKDTNLIKLLMEYNPDLSITTYNDNLSCFNYADISENEEINHLIRSKVTASKEIKSKLKDFINNVETKNTITSNESMNKYDILNYCGETYKSSTKTDASELKINEEKPINMNDIYNDKNKNEIILDNKEIFEKDIYINKSNYSTKGLVPVNIVILDKKENKDTPIQLNKTIYQKKKISLSKTENPTYKFLTEKKNKKYFNVFNVKEIDIKRKKLNGGSYSLDIFESTKNNNIKEDDNNHLENNHIEINSPNLEDNKSQLEIFFTEINLPKEYAHNFIDNGFDDLNLLLFQTQSGIAISNQNLIDIGISICGERAKILIHLEEKAGVIKYIMERNKLYINEPNSAISNNSLFKFLASINLEQYEKNFIDNGYYTSELLFSQMLTRQPINEDMLKKDIKIAKTGHRVRIYNKLVNDSKEYVKNLKNRSNSKMIYDGPSLKACEPCMIY